MTSNGKSAVICDVQHPAISAVLLSFYRDALIAFAKIEIGISSANAASAEGCWRSSSSRSWIEG